MTSWEESNSWYDSIVGEKGHYYHQTVIFPNALRMLKLNAKTSLLDIGCGNGVLQKHLPKGVEYTGLDIAKREHLIQADATKPLPIEKKDFDIACFILSLQNMDPGQDAIKHAAQHLKPRGKMLLVLNHPCFRIPRQSAWGVDEQAKLQYRRINRYLSPLKIPIQTHPSKQSSETTWSFHHPLSTYVHWLKTNGLIVQDLEEWRSDKQSVGKWAKMEDRAREEFPLFLAVLGEKK